MSLAAWDSSPVRKSGDGASGACVGRDASVKERAHALATLWAVLALGALGASTLFAVILVFARTPFLGLGAEYFRTALVLHVDLAVVVWFLSVACALWMMASPPSGGLARRMVFVAWAASLSGVLLMLAAPLIGDPLPILANYVPLLDSPIFIAGVVMYFAGVGLCALLSLGSMISARLVRATTVNFEPWHGFVAGAMVSLLIALLVFVLALAADAETLTMDDRIWGGGHVLQVVHTLMLMAAWLSLARVNPGIFWIAGLLGFALLAPLADLWLAIVHPAGSVTYRQGFTEVMRWLTWPAPVVLAIWVVHAYRRQWAVQGRGSEDIPALASVALFVMGCLVGASIRGETTAIPGHYHGTVGAVTLIYMVWGRVLLRERGLALPLSWWWRWQPLIYAGGIALLVLGLAWAGWLGVPRKSPHADGIVDGVRYSLAMGLAGTGGLLATLGAGLFVLGVGRVIARVWWSSRWKVAS